MLLKTLRIFPPPVICGSFRLFGKIFAQIVGLGLCFGVCLNFFGFIVELLFQIVFRLDHDAVCLGTSVFIGVDIGEEAVDDEVSGLAVADLDVGSQTCAAGIADAAVKDDHLPFGNRLGER